MIGRRSSAPGGVGGHPTGIRVMTARRAAPSVRSDLCRARSRHQQLPAAGRAPDRRQLPRHRRVLPHHPARRGRLDVRPYQRGGDRACGRGARGLPRQDAQPRRDARATDRDRGLPRRGERRTSSAPASPRRSASSSRSSTARPRPMLAATGCTPLIDPHADGVILFDIGGGSSELVRLDRLAAVPARSAAAEDRGLGVAAGRRGHAGRAPRRHRGHPAKSTRR